jgi:hypothetical protein
MGLRRRSNFWELESFHLRKMVQMMKTPPIEAAIAMRTVNVVLLTWELAAFPCLSGVTDCEAATEAVRVTAGTMMVLTPTASSVVERLLEADVEGLADDTELADFCDTEAEEVAEVETVDTTLFPARVVDVSDEVEVVDVVVSVFAAGAAVLSLETTGKGAAPTSGPSVAWGKGARFFITRFMLIFA